MTITLEQRDAITRNCAADSTWFFRAAFGFRPWSEQKKIFSSFRHHQQTLVFSGHSVGKTVSLASIVLERMATKHPSKTVCISGSAGQLSTGLWSEVSALYRRSKIAIGGELQTRIWHGATEDSFVVCKSVDNPVNLQGVHGPDVAVIVDEAEAVDMETWDAINSLMSSSNVRLIVALNPLVASGYCYEASLRPDLWNIISISCLDHPNVVLGEDVIPGAVTKSWVEQRRSEWGESDPRWAARVLGRFPTTGTRQLVSLADLDLVAETGIEGRETPRAGLDIARFGGDSNVLVVFDERRRLVECDAWNDCDLMTTCGRAAEVVRRHGAQLRVDVCGMGAGVVDRMRETGLSVDAVDFGGGVEGDWNLGDTPFVNRKAQLHYVLRHVVREKAIGIPKKFARVRADLAAIQYDYDSHGRFKVEDKEAIRKRIGRSPDYGDAVVIALSNSGHYSPEDFFPRSFE